VLINGAPKVFICWSHDPWIDYSNSNWYKKELTTFVQAETKFYCTFLAANHMYCHGRLQSSIFIQQTILQSCCNYIICNVQSIYHWTQEHILEYLVNRLMMMFENPMLVNERQCCQHIYTTETLAAMTTKVWNYWYSHSSSVHN